MPYLHPRGTPGGGGRVPTHKIDKLVQVFGRDFKTPNPVTDTV